MTYIQNLIIVCLSISLLCISKANAQQAEIKAIAKVDTLAKGKKIMIRWAPSTPSLWKLSNKQNAGYKLEKIRIVKNGLLLATPEKVGNDIILKVPDFDTLSTNSYEKRNNWYTKFVAGSLTGELVKPNPPSVEGNSLKYDPLSMNYAAMWQAIYGISFDMNSFKSDGIIDETDEFQKRYNTALAAAENYFEVAKFVGLGYEDNNVVKGERYLYRISALAQGYTTVVGSVYIGLDDDENITKIPPYEFSVSYVDSVAYINWNTTMLKKYYSSYNLYRSINGDPYVKINKGPIANLDDETGISFSDSLGIYNSNIKKYNFNLNTTFAYKLHGITPFGEEGPSSEVFTGKIRRILRVVPIMTGLDMQEVKGDTNMFVIAKWKFDSTVVNLIDGFRISYSDSTNGVFVPIGAVISTNPLNGTPHYTKKITEIRVTKTTYFKVTALAKEGENKESFASVVTPIDSIAPLPPKIVSVQQLSKIKKGEDSLLIIKVTWQVEQPNRIENKNIVGYRVYRSQFMKEEATQITNEKDWTGTFYVDTLYHTKVSKFETYNKKGDTLKSSVGNNVYTINKSVFYQVLAVDDNYNQSKLSVKMEFKRPDRVPLPPSVFSRYSVDEDGISLNWSGYADTTSFGDFQEFQIMRGKIPKSIVDNKLKMDTLKTNDSQLTWMQLAVITDPVDTTYIDVDAVADSVYAYFIVSKDLSGNVGRSNIIIVQYSNTSNFDYTEPSISSFLVTKPTGKAYTKLNWTHTSTKVAEYQILRGVNENSLEILRVVGATEKEFFDEDIKTGSLYKYGIRALYNNTKRSEMKRAEILY